MKKIVVLLLVLIITILPMTSFANSSIKEAKYFNGAVFMKNADDELVEAAVVSNVYVKKSENEINGSFKAEKDKIEFSAKIITEKDGISYYNGTLILDNKNFKCDIIENNSGLSILYYDSSRKFVRSVILTAIDVDLDQIKNKINKEVVPKIKEEKLKVEVIEETTIGDISSRSYPINNTHHMFKDAFSIPLVIGGGTVEGWFHYQTNIDPSAEFYAVDMDAIINWVTGFDSIIITNPDEGYGIFWGTPGCPTKNLQTFSIGMMAEKQSPYKMEATVSYYLLVRSLPILFWDTDEEYFSY